MWIINESINTFYIVDNWVFFYTKVKHWNEFFWNRKMLKVAISVLYSHLVAILKIGRKSSQSDVNIEVVQNVGSCS